MKSSKPALIILFFIVLIGVLISCIAALVLVFFSIQRSDKEETKSDDEKRVPVVTVSPTPSATNNSSNDPLEELLKYRDNNCESNIAESLGKNSGDFAIEDLKLPNLNLPNRGEFLITTSLRDISASLFDYDILNSDGEVVYTLYKVRSFSLSHDGKKVAYKGFDLENCTDEVEGVLDLTTGKFTSLNIDYSDAVGSGYTSSDITVPRFSWSLKDEFLTVSVLNTYEFNAFAYLIDTFGMKEIKVFEYQYDPMNSTKIYRCMGPNCLIPDIVYNPTNDSFFIYNIDNSSKPVLEEYDYSSEKKENSYSLLKEFETNPENILPMNMISNSTFGYGTKGSFCETIELPSGGGNTFFCQYNKKISYDFKNTINL